MHPEERALKWGQHPLISAVLWALGTPESRAAICEDALRLRRTGSAPLLPHASSSSCSLKERISWKDERGGTIEEQCSLQSSHTHNHTQTNTRTQPVSDKSHTTQHFHTAHTPHKIAAQRSQGETDTEGESSVSLAVSVDLHTHVNTKNNTHANVFSSSSSTTITTSAASVSEKSTTYTLPTRFDAPEAAQSAEISTSPYGFFVNMTPTEPEVFARSAGSLCPPFPRSG